MFSILHSFLKRRNVMNDKYWYTELQKPGRSSTILGSNKKHTKWIWYSTRKNKHASSLKTLRHLIIVPLLVVYHNGSSYHLSPYSTYPTFLFLRWVCDKVKEPRVFLSLKTERVLFFCFVLCWPDLCVHLRNREFPCKWEYENNISIPVHRWTSNKPQLYLSMSLQASVNKNTYRHHVSKEH